MISPFDIATDGYKANPLSIATNGYITIVDALLNVYYGTLKVLKIFRGTLEVTKVLRG